MKNILVFTDSRGQHKPSGTDHLIFGERLKYELRDVSVDLVLCPMKWTTIIDFLEYADAYDLSNYDHIILFLGIVDWSPRPVQSAIDALYSNKETANLGSWLDNTRDYSRKIVNNKKPAFDRIFGEKEMSRHFSNAFDEEFEGQKTINMYSVEMARRNLYPRLKNFENIIFINSNRIVSGWDGDFKRGRPVNIGITHQYADAFSQFFPSDRLIDLRSWSDAEVKKYTCDNMHLTKSGSDYIFDEVVKMIGGNLNNQFETSKEVIDSSLEKDLEKLVDFKSIEKFSGEKAKDFVSRYTNKQFLATLIIGFRVRDGDPTREENLEFLVKWLKAHYGNMFDILLVEQDETRNFYNSNVLDVEAVRYEFLYNPAEYNRGWGYNVAVKHFCQDSDVVVLMDTDVLTGSNFVADVRDCLIGKHKVISPYQNVYYTTQEESEEVRGSYSLSSLRNLKNVKNPVTISGGVVILDRKTYLEIKGFEQYIGYGCEDRALDVHLLESLSPDDLKISSCIYVHLYHPNDVTARKNFKEIYKHLVDNYKCEWSSALTPESFIHRDCKHVSRDKLASLLIEKSKSFADVDLYRHDKPLKINGVLDEENKGCSITLPPDFSSFDSYESAELYEAPDPDFSELQQFRNAFLGERCFIIGNGPSLNEHDLSLLEGEYTFGVNSFYYKTRETGFRPTFYVVEDSSVMKENLSEIKDFYAPFKFFPTVYKKLHPKTPNTFFFNMNRGFYEKTSPNFCVPRFSTDASKVLYCGQSVTYINLQLAYFMGFSEVYLIGMDFSYVIPKSHKRKGDVLTSDSDDPNHFHKDYFGKGKTWKDPKLDRVGNNYRMAKLAYESVGRRIFNATVGGSLEIFERVPYYSLFSKKSSLEKPMLLDDNSFSDGNDLFRDGRYSDALVVFLRLAELYPEFEAYRSAAISSFSKAKASSQPIQDEVVDRFKEIVFN